LSVQFRRRLESEEAYVIVDHLRELIQIEQLNTSLDLELPSWLLDQKPKNMSEAARLVDQHVAIHTAGRFNQSSRDGKPGATFHEKISHIRTSHSLTLRPRTVSSLRLRVTLTDRNSMLPVLENLL